MKTATMCEIAGAGGIKNDCAVCKSFCVQHVGMNLILVLGPVKVWSCLRFLLKHDFDSARACSKYSSASACWHMVAVRGSHVWEPGICNSNIAGGCPLFAAITSAVETTEGDSLKRSRRLTVAFEEEKGGMSHVAQDLLRPIFGDVRMQC